ncbi:MAG: hypothetical protein O3A51_14740, partial [Verrucomicrobia bacterium]|nr:hypothetical protein [Verrucomicrobiota bacterium]
PEILVQLKTPASGLDPNELTDRVGALADVGVTRISLGANYATAEEFRGIVELAALLSDKG